MSKNMKRIEDVVPMAFRYSFDEMVAALNEAKKRGERVFCNFNGHTFYSIGFDETQAYLEFYDMTKEERDYYRQNKDGIIIGMISCTYASLFIDDEDYKDFVGTIIARSSPELLQAYEYALRNAGDIICGTPQPDYLKRFNQFSDERKNTARDFIDKYISNKYKKTALEGLGLTQRQKN